MKVVDTTFEYRTGLGTDIHRLDEDEKLFLGGVEIPFDKGLVGHSDGDVVIHAVIDAILGAACIGDIGEFFPNSDERYHNIDSKKLLSFVIEITESEKWEFVNIDIVIKAEEPNLSAYKKQIKRSIADICGADFAKVNIKAKTNEGMGAVGRCEAIEAMAMVLLRRAVKNKF
ncbi:2-C-methyl-D-erythritol 2,4-cyclodiphosphate synthase [Sedimentisphaera salicampi]|uniref:2-C-methyl-D-erythritol 2,4-cyclodiphosphate synthase n=1 Tax=Sedimentisphaera salicampi TaxID=1941349 RepID=A0A1W6LKR9_9BACT|nr:2-C-methyl-D-erythritol 2,4-cyclodiphosphate synthase [Sedimentisphaera salicampi]ARN56390.1 2-C-methyl-D-erythritol 2,4-cyclodiphosphate synthase [Sedimentisphaera salicampi]